MIWQPWQLFTLILAGMSSRDKDQVINYQRIEIEVLRELLGKRRLRLSDDQRRRLAVEGQTLGWKRLHGVAQIVTPDTILRWHRQLVAAKWDTSDGRGQSPGRPPLSEEVEKLVVQFAKENPTWGYNRIQGALANLGYAISDTTVGNILRAHGIEPAPKRKRTTSWKTFIQAHWDTLAAVDFTTVEVWTRGGLVTFYLLFAMRLATRKVHLAGTTTNPDGPWMHQTAKNLTDCDDGFLNGATHLLLDRDTKFTAQFQATLHVAGVEPKLLPPRSPNLNAHMERFMRSIKDECLSRMIFFGESSLRNAVREFLAHYHAERNHQGLDNQLIEPHPDVGKTAGVIQCRERLGGMLKYYHRAAA